MRFIKPIDEEAILSLASQPSMSFITLEEGVLAGGFGAAVLELLSDHQLSNSVVRLGIPDQFIEHGNVTAQYAEMGLDRQGIVKAALKLAPTTENPARRSRELAH
jgi:1-deoxy-D-xylulose-5-phosphate synthase